MKTKEIDTIINLPANKRYEYFVKKVADFEEVWGLYNNGWATAEDDQGNIVIPFWPNKEFADLCVVENWVGYTAKSIRIGDFIEKWLPGMQRDNRLAAIFYTIKDSGVVVDLKKLKIDLQMELDKY